MGNCCFSKGRPASYMDYSRECPNPWGAGGRFSWTMRTHQWRSVGMCLQLQPANQMSVPLPLACICSRDARKVILLACLFLSCGIFDNPLQCTTKTAWCQGGHRRIADRFTSAAFCTNSCLQLQPGVALRVGFGSVIYTVAGAHSSDSFFRQANFLVQAVS